MSKIDLCHSLLCQDAYWMVNKKLAKLLGRDAALLLADLLSKEKFFKIKGKLPESGFFFNSQKDIEDNTTLTPYEQRKNLTILENHEVLLTQIKKIGNGTTTKHFKIDHDKIISLLSRSENQAENQNSLHREVKIFDDYSNNKHNNNVLSKDNTVGLSKESPTIEFCELVEYWNKKENLRKHRPNTKVYKEAKKLFAILQNGLFGKTYNLNENYVKSNKISPETLNKKWSVEEIKAIIDKYNKMCSKDYGADWKDKYPKNCSSFIYNPMTFTSFFLALAYKEPFEKNEKIKDQPVYNMYRATFFSRKSLNHAEERELIKSVNFVVKRREEYFETIGKYFCPTAFKEMGFYRSHINFIRNRYFDSGVFDISKIGNQNIWRKYVVWVKQEKGKEYDLMPTTEMIVKAKQFHNKQQGRNNNPSW